MNDVDVIAKAKSDIKCNGYDNQCEGWALSNGT